jgi:hypothetical protein
MPGALAEVEIMLAIAHGDGLSGYGLRCQSSNEAQSRSPPEVKRF